MEQRREDIGRFISRSEEGEAINLKAFLRKLAGYWRWFVPAMLAGAGVALLYNAYSPATYGVTGTLFVEEKTEEKISLNDIFDNLQLRHDVKIPNHLGLLTSFSLNRQVIGKLGWNVVWFREGRFRNSPLNTEDPFEVVPDTTEGNLPNVPLYIEKLSPDSFTISTGATPLVVGQDVEISFSETGRFGEKFSNQYFHFTLNDKDLPLEGRFYFMFKDRDELALDYIKRLEVTRLDKNMDLIRVWLRTTNPGKDIEYVKELEKAYVEFGLRQKQLAADNSIRFIERQLASVADSAGRHTALYTYLTERRAEAEIRKASLTADVKIIDEPRDSTVVAVGPRKAINLLIGLFFGFAIPFLFMILREFFKETVGSSDELSRISPLPVVGVIRHNPDPDKIPVIKYPRSAVAESFRGLRVGIGNFAGERTVLTIGVHSMIPKEGKTFVALNLACIFAMNRKKVLLIDADLRKPELHSWLKMNNQHGLSTCLAADDSAEKIITPSPVPNLDLILSGPVLPNPAEFIESQEFGFMLAGLKSRYDIIILDNGPQEMVTEGAVVMRHTDLDLYVVRRGYTPRSVFAGLHRAVGTGSNKAAIVFNDALTERSPGASKRESQLFELEYFTDAPLMDFKKSR